MASPIEVAGMAEAAEIVGVTKSNFSAHRTRFCGEDECPAPTAKLVCGPVWAGPDVAKLRKWGKKFATSRTVRSPSTVKASDVPAAMPMKAAPAKAAPAKAAPAKAAVAKKAAPAAAPSKKKGLFGSA